MPKIRFAVALSCLLALCAAGLYADRVMYITSGAEPSVVTARDATVTSWSASELRFRNAEGGSVTVDHRRVVSVDRTGGTMSDALGRAMSQMGTDPEGALATLQDVSRNAEGLDKEEATYRIAKLYDEAAAADESATARAVNAYDSYLDTYPDGYFAREAYRRLADFRLRAEQVDAARRTFRDMAGADASMRREANQWLGELEAGLGNWKPAINAFKSAKNAAGTDKIGQYLARAWEGLCTLKDGDADGAEALLQPIVDDDNFDDPISGDDEIVLAVAHRSLGDLHKAREDWSDAYDAYVKGAYYSWWTQGSNEGYCLAEAYVCAGRLESLEDDSSEVDWGDRRSKLRTALAVGYPRELRRVDND